MAGTVRISQLTEVSNLAADGVIIVNTDFNTDTRTITFENFQKSYGAVKSINGQQPDATFGVTLTPAIIGTYSTAEVDAALSDKVDLATFNAFNLEYNEFVTLEFTPVKDRSVANATAISVAEIAIAQNTADITDNTADIATNTSNIATNTADIATNKSDIATLQSTVSGNSSGVTGNTGDIAALTARVTTLDAATTGKVPVLEADVVTLKSDVLANTAKGTSNHQLVNALAAAVETAATSVAAGDTVQQAFAKLTTAMANFIAANPAP